MRLDLTLFAVGLCSVSADNTVSGLNLQPAAPIANGASAAPAPANPLALLSALAPQLSSLAPQLSALTSLLSAGQSLPSIADLLSLSGAILPSAASSQKPDVKALQQVTGSPAAASAAGAPAANPLAALQDPQALLASLGGMAQAPAGLAGITSLLGGAGGMDPTALLSSISNPSAMLGALGAPSAMLGSLGDPSAMLGALSNPTAMLQSLGNPGSMLQSLGSPGSLLPSLGDPSAMLTSLGNPTSLLQSMFNQSAAATTLGNALGTPGGANPSTMDAVANAFVTNGYLNVAGQNAIKLSGMANEAYNYPDLTAALNGQAPVTDADGKLTLAVQQGLRQLGIVAATPSDLVSTVMGSAFSGKRRLSPQSNLADALQHFYDALKEAGHEMTSQTAQHRRLQSVYPPMQSQGAGMANPNAMPFNPNMMMRNPNVMPADRNAMPGSPNIMMGNTNMMPGVMSMMPGTTNMMNPGMMSGNLNMMPGSSNVLTSNPSMMNRSPNPVYPGGMHMGIQNGASMGGNPYNGMQRSIPQGTVLGTPYNNMASGDMGNRMARLAPGIAENSIMGGRSIPSGNMRSGGNRAFNSMLDTSFLSVPPIIMESNRRSSYALDSDMTGDSGMLFNSLHANRPSDSSNNNNNMRVGDRNRNSHDDDHNMRLGDRNYNNRNSNSNVRMNERNNMMDGQRSNSGSHQSRVFNDFDGSDLMMDGMQNRMNGPLMGNPRSNLYGNDNGGMMSPDRNGRMTVPNLMMGGNYGTPANMMGGNYGRSPGLGREDRYRRDDDSFRNQGNRDRPRFQSLDAPTVGGGKINSEKPETLLSADAASSLEEVAVREGAREEAKRRLSAKSSLSGSNLVSRMKRALAAVRGTLKTPTVSISQDDFSRLVKKMSPAHLWMALDHASGHRQLSSWIDSALDKVQSSVASTSPDWREHVQSAADELANALEGMAGKLKEGDLPSKIQSWWNDFTKEVQQVEEAKAKSSANGRIMEMTRRRLQEAWLGEDNGRLGPFARANNYSPSFPASPSSLMATPYGPAASGLFANDQIDQPYPTQPRLGEAYSMQQMDETMGNMMQQSMPQVNDAYMMQQTGSPMDLFGSIGNSFGSITQPFLGGVASLTQPFMESLSLATNSRDGSSGALNTGLLQSGLSALGLRRLQEEDTSLGAAGPAPVAGGSSLVGTQHSSTVTPLGSQHASSVMTQASGALPHPLPVGNNGGLNISALSNAANLGGMDLSTLGNLGGLDLSALTNGANLGGLGVPALGNVGGANGPGVAQPAAAGGMGLSQLSNIGGLLGGLNISSLAGGTGLGSLGLTGLGGVQPLGNMTSLTSGLLGSTGGLPDLSNLLGNLPGVDMSALNGLVKLGSLDLTSLTNLAHLGSMDLSNLAGISQMPHPVLSGLGGFNLSALTSGLTPTSVSSILSLPTLGGNVTAITGVDKSDGDDREDGDDKRSMLPTAGQINIQGVGSPEILPSSLHDVAASVKPAAPAAANPFDSLLQLGQSLPGVLGGAPGVGAPDLSALANSMSGLLGGAAGIGAPDLSTLANSMTGLLGGSSGAGAPDLSALAASMSGLLGGATKPGSPDLSALTNSMSGLLGGAPLSDLGLSPEVLASLSSLSQGMATRRRLQAVDAQHAYVRQLQDIAGLTAQLNSALHGLPGANALGGLNLGSLPGLGNASPLGGLSMGSVPGLGSGNPLGGLGLASVPSLTNQSPLGLNVGSLPSLGSPQPLGGLQLPNLGTPSTLGGLNLNQLGGIGGLNLGSLTGLGSNPLGGLGGLNLLGAGNATIIQDGNTGKDAGITKQPALQGAGDELPLMNMQDFLEDVNRAKVDLTSMGESAPGLNLNDLASQLGSSNLNVTLLIQRLASSNLDINALVAQGRKGQLTPDSLIAALTNSDIDLNSLADQISSSGIDLNNLVAGINKGGLSIDDLFNSLTASGVDWNSLIKQIDSSGLDLNQMLQQLAASGIDLSFMANSGILPTIINSGVITNSGLANILTSMDDGKSVSPIALTAAASEASNSLRAALNTTQSSLDAKVQRRLLEAAGASHRSSFALINSMHTPKRRLWSLLEAPDNSSGTPAEMYAPTEEEEAPTAGSARDVDVKYLQEVKFTPNNASFVATSENLNMSWSLSADAPIVAPILACWEVPHLASSDDDWPKFVVESVSLDLIVDEAVLNSIDLLYPESENLFQYYTPNWNKAHIVQRKQNTSCTWIPMCVLHEALNQVQQTSQTSSPITSSLTIRANKVPATNDLVLPTAKILVRAVGATGEWSQIAEDESASSSALLLKPIAKIEKIFEEAPVFSFELPKPTASQIGSASALAGYAVVASATATGLDFVFGLEDWQWIPERARPAYGRILEQLKTFEEDDETESAPRDEDQEDEYSASSVSSFNPKRDLPLRVPEFTFLPRIVLEATSRSAADGHQTVIQRCLPMATTTQSVTLSTGLADPLSATVMEMLYASAGSAQTSMRMKSYLEAVPMQALVASQEGFRTFDLRGSLIDDFSKIKWEAGVRLSPINSNMLGGMASECEGITCNLY